MPGSEGPATGLGFQGLKVLHFTVEGSELRA